MMLSQIQNRRMDGSPTRKCSARHAQVNRYTIYLADFQLGRHKKYTKFLLDWASYVGTRVPQQRYTYL